MGDVKDHVGMVEQNLQTLEDHVLEELESLKRAVGAQDELRERFTELFNSLQEQLDVVKEFTTLMLHIPNMAEEDLLFNFVDGLQSWAKKELQRRGVKDVDEAIAMAESLMEYDRGGESSKPKWEDEASEGDHANGGGESPKAWHKGDKHASTSKTEGHDKLQERRMSRKLKDCFFCGGPHWARDCPRQGKMAALIEEKEKEKAECETVHIGSIQVLNALQKKNVPQVPTGEGQASKSEGLLYMEAKLNGKLAHVLMDTGATHNFITMGEAERLGLNVVDGGGWLKPVNAEAKPLQGMVRRVEICLGKWKGFVDFSVARMDDFKVVLGLDFLRQVNALVSPYNNAVCIMERGTACVVPMFGGTSSTMTPTSMRLSGMRLVEGVKDVEAKGEGTYLASLKVEDRLAGIDDQQPKEMVGDFKGKKDAMPWGQPSRKARNVREARKGAAKGAESVLKGKENVPLSEPPRETKDVLKPKQGLLPRESEKRQPPRRKVDREGELDRGAKPQNVVPCGLVPQSLEKVAAMSKTKRSHTVQEKRNMKTCLGDKQDKAERRSKRRPREYNLGDLVMVKTLRKVHKGFVSRYEGPFPITAKIGKASYQVQLPPKPKVHAVFHVSLLRSHIARMEDHDHGKSRRTPTVEVKFYDKKTENVLNGEAQVKAWSCTNKALLGQLSQNISMFTRYVSLNKSSMPSCP
ncbi:hypothetical protein RJ640_007303 [Escallonia rubra]|uniref:Tf2-1-like SH3-like domain-containing protein n=1 Tax=Escallonia rubra TaxID=112253 RepID=A0AA88RF60_9ASTE|nr:hypothetical protein RJ640_007303 [Escallonia rubra]